MPKVYSMDLRERVAADQDRPDVAERRACWRVEQLIRSAGHRRVKDLWRDTQRLLDTMPDRRQELLPPLRLFAIDKVNPL